jgi:hypothetical protein
MTFSIKKHTITIKNATLRIIKLSITTLSMMTLIIMILSTAMKMQPLHV